MTSRNADQSELQSISVSADGKCSAAVEEKILAHYGAQFGTDLVDRDRDFTRDRAIMFANERDDVCSMKQ
jgi:hypothetical protein